MVGSCGATPPASNTTVRLGACVRWASIAAAHGTPVPTATVRPSSSSRAAQQIISSIAVYGADTARPRPGSLRQDGRKKRSRDLNLKTVAQSALKESLDLPPSYQTTAAFQEGSGKN